MLSILFGVFVVLHGLVHLLYFGQSRRLYELQPGMVWPDGSWAWSQFLGIESLRLMASVFCILGAVGFVAGGIGMLLRQTWWRPIIVGVAAFSSVFYILLWDGKLRGLDDQGGIGLIINVVVIVLVLTDLLPT